MARKREVSAMQMLGQDIAKLFLALKLPNEVKHAWADSVLRMTPKQMCSAVEILNMHAQGEMVGLVKDIQRRYCDLVK